MQSLKVHSGSVRSLAILSTGSLVSASLDKSVKMYHLTDHGHYDFDKELTFHE